MRQEQIALAGAALAVWIAIALLLTPTEPRTAVRDPAEWRNELKETLKKPIPVAPDPVVISPAPVVADRAGRAGIAGTLTALKQVSEICSDLSALADPGALEGALARVNTVLNATGLIVWIASNDGGSLSPVATHGFDPKLVARIGKINRDGTNLTAAAFRENSAENQRRDGDRACGASPSRCAAPPAPPACCLSSSRPGRSVDEAKVAAGGDHRGTIGDAGDADSSTRPAPRASKQAKRAAIQ